jgi:ribosome biogenesis protein MAK21
MAILAHFMLQLFNTIPGLRVMLEANASASEDSSSLDADACYDPRKRDPQYAHASSSPIWELV